MKPGALLPLALLLCGCAASPTGSRGAATEGLQLTAQPTSPAAGGVAALSLHNGAAEPVGQNLCFAALERFRGGLWVPSRSIAKGCPEVFHPLAPGQQASGQSPLPQGMAGGDYRVVTRVHAPLGSVVPEQVRSDRFTVAEAGD
jgi:hypothetical protein